jgi:hypothetical protein
MRTCDTCDFANTNSVSSCPALSESNMDVLEREELCKKTRTTSDAK